MQPLGKIRPGSIISGPELDDAKRRLNFLQIFNADPSQGTVPNIQVDRGEDSFSEDERDR
jgi:hypothetical protein